MIRHLTKYKKIMPLVPHSPLRDFARLAKALGDPHRLHALMALRSGELCLCALIALLRLAPSTVSKHMQLLELAGLITPRKSDCWVHYRLATRGTPPNVRAILRSVTAALAHDPLVAADARRLPHIRSVDARKLAACYRKRS